MSIRKNELFSSEELRFNTTESYIDVVSIMNKCTRAVYSFILGLSLSNEKYNRNNASIAYHHFSIIELPHCNSCNNKTCILTL